MTPQEEQAAMQAFVRQRLAAQGQQQQLNLAPGQVPLAPEEQGQFLQDPLQRPLSRPPADEPDPGAASFVNNAAVDEARGGLVPGPQSNIAPDPYYGAPPTTVGIQGGASSRRLQDAGRALRQAAPASQFMVRKSVPF